MMRTIVFDGLKKTLGKETAPEMRREKRERKKKYSAFTITVPFLPTLLETLRAHGAFGTKELSQASAAAGIFRNVK